MQINYPNEDLVIEYNTLAITMFDVKKADQVKVLNYSKISKAISKCKEIEQDIYGKAAVLLKELVRAHAFASGNRRTAFITTIDFVKRNGKKFKIKDDPDNARVLTGIREEFYSIDEIKEWINNGKIRKFER